MSKISSINKRHIHELYVDRRNVVSSASTVDAVAPIRGAENNTFYSDGNFLYYSDSFYDHLNRFEKAYQSFYTHNNRLSKLSKVITRKNGGEEQKGFQINNLVKILQLIIKEYNQTMSCLKNVESESQIHLSSRIEDFILKEQYFLGYIGITLQDNGLCHFSPWIFYNNYYRNSEKILFLMSHKAGLLQKISNLFKTVTLEAEDSKGYQSMDSQLEQGVLLDRLT